MNSRIILAANWKMNLGAQGSQALAQQLASGSSKLKKTEIWVAPSFPALSATSTAIKGSSVKLGAQNVHWAEKGAFTGEVSVTMLREVGCSFAIVGHSERRHICGEQNELVAKRALFALHSNFSAILCIGETDNERQRSETNAVIERQLRPVFTEMAESEAPNLVIAYEPVWAIGTGKTPSLAEIEDAHSFIANYWGENHPTVTCPPILYGGSVTPDNFKGIVNIPGVAGALVGGASLTMQSFGDLIRIAEETSHR